MPGWVPRKDTGGERRCQNPLTKRHQSEKPGGNNPHFLHFMHRFDQEYSTLSAPSLLVYSGVWDIPVTTVRIVLKTDYRQFCTVSQD